MVPFSWPQRNANNSSGFIQNEGRRQRSDSKPGRDFTFGIQQGGKRQLIFFKKRFYLSFAFLQINGDHGKVLIFEPTMQFFHRGHLDNTGGTPGRPKIKKHDFPAKI